jgi:two-component system response regulator
MTILLAEDDEDDRLLTRDALMDEGMAESMRCVGDGQELLDYLRHDGDYSPANVTAPRPSLILLDLNMPRMDGREALAEIKGDSALRRIPVVVLTTSSDQQDINNAYLLGANSYITKPIDPTQLVEVMKAVTDYWSDTVLLPDDELRG